MKQTKDPELSLKDEFKGFLHDITSPLTVIQYQLDRASSTLTEDQQQYIADILNSAALNLNNLNRMVIATRRMLNGNSDETVFSVAAELHAIAEMYGPFAGARGVRLLEEYDDDRMIAGEVTLFRRIIGNLIQNALEALETVSDPGYVLLRTRRTREWFQIEITDNGPGIPEKIQSRLFRKGISSKGMDRGMGLSLAKDLLRDRFGARITSVSRGKGACFLIRFYKVRSENPSV
ncbi:MAG: Nitrogen regulation protein NR(II) [candidate division WS6 bacterium OLB20]|uniref:histidine kinase n=1 Tax=candidate division WS6 bacterium OLB20 TaxID=1617426 RepID=A0A136LWH7_9BACT|nr:MAG: Nitrogen regulation protein NR(II) [candidate division WS6 bacterium OLB20]